MKSIAVLVLASLTSCAWSFGGRRPEGVVIYSIQPETLCRDGASWCKDKGPGLYAPSDKKFKKLSEATNWPTMSPGDLNKVIQACPK